MADNSMATDSHNRVDAAKALEEQIRLLKEVAPYSTDSCVIATLIAITDEKDDRVRKKLLDRAKPENLLIYEPLGVKCLEPDLLFNQRVLFKYRCRPPVICLVDPSFLAIVSIPSRRIIDFHDPYVPTALTPWRTTMCACSNKPAYGEGGARNDAIDALKNLVGSVLGEELQCNAMAGSGDCNSIERCRRAFRFLEAFQDNPNRDTVQDLSDYVNGSDRNRKCMRRIFEVASADFGEFVALLATILG